MSHTLSRHIFTRYDLNAALAFAFAALSLANYSPSGANRTRGKLRPEQAS